MLRLISPYSFGSHIGGAHGNPVTYRGARRAGALGDLLFIGED